MEAELASRRAQAEEADRKVCERLVWLHIAHVMLTVVYEACSSNLDVSTLPCAIKHDRM